MPLFRCKPLRKREHGSMEIMLQQLEHAIKEFALLEKQLSNGQHLKQNFVQSLYAQTKNFLVLHVLRRLKIKSR